MRVILVFAIVLTCCSSMLYAQEESTDFVYDDKNKRDPLWSLVSSSGVIMNYDEEISLTEIDLQGIMSSPEGGGVAIINGRVYEKNQKVGQYVIKNITQKSVTLSDGSTTFDLRLKKEE